ncbi:GNAT family N-acetyltransferase [Nocardioides marinquilinus]|uniref:GNAT family N-acetyltransferase n=1 Tax=Nocardioides marinquilinus TaxID=1210400 RepID=A0ABP9PNY6_9ACTN
MEIRPFGPDDDAALRAWVTVSNRCRDVDSPWTPPDTERGARVRFSQGWDGEPSLGFVGEHEGEVVAIGALNYSDRDNLHLAWLSLEVDPAHRRRGLGSRLLERLEAEAAGMGRTTVGASCWDDAGLLAFATRHGYEQRAVNINRRQVLADVDPATLDAIFEESAAASSDYELVRRHGPTPESELEALALLTAAINDAPTDDLDFEDEVFDAERVAAYERAQVARGGELYRLLARHRASGELAGQTVVVVDGENPAHAGQHDTSVLGAHRGHRLGALLKSGILRWLREEQPQLAEIDTWNAESNAPMIGVNERLGYRVMGRELQVQRTL